MISWKDMPDLGYTEADRRRWRKRLCAHASHTGDGRCLGYSARLDDEPCEICKCCTELGIEVDDDN